LTIRLHWYLPTSGDGRDVVGWVNSAIATRERRPADRPPDIGYLADVARAAERFGFDAVLTPTGTWCEDPWLVTAALLGETATLRFIVAIRPDAMSPTLAAQMAATFQQISHGRLLLNIVCGSDDDEQRRFGDWLEHDARYDRAEEFLQIFRGAWSGHPFDFDGRYYRVAGATIGATQAERPALYIGGASEAAQRVVGGHADVCLMWGEPPAATAERIAAVRSRTGLYQRTPRFAVRLHVITRDTSAQAWAEADRLLAAMDPVAISVAQRQFARTTSVGQQRMAALHGGRTDALEVSPNLWAGYGLLRRHAGTALVGSHREVADRIAEYHQLGIDEFIFSNQPHLEEAYQFGEGVLPILRDRGLHSTTQQTALPVDLVAS
jgi:alkanesulfonate monooxygenase